MSNIIYGRIGIEIGTVCPGEWKGGKQESKGRRLLPLLLLLLSLSKRIGGMKYEKYVCVICYYASPYYLSSIWYNFMNIQQTSLQSIPFKLFIPAWKWEILTVRM